MDEYPVVRLDEVDGRRRGIDAPEVALQRVERDLTERARELDARRAAADDHEHQPGGLDRRVGLALRRLERDQDPPADLRRIVDGLETGRHRGPVLVPEVAVARAGGHDQGVVRHRPAITQHHPPLVGCQAHRLTEQDPRVLAPTQDRAKRLRDLARRERPGRDLVQQRLEQVVIAPVDQRHRDIGLVTERLRGVEPAEPTADDDDAMPSSALARHAGGPGRRGAARSVGRDGRGRRLGRGHGQSLGPERDRRRQRARAQER